MDVRFSLADAAQAAINSLPFNLPKSERLLKSHQFRRVSKYGRTRSGKYLVIQLCESRGSLVKLGLTVSRKFGKAVQRNRFKRLIREAFRHTKHSLPSGLHLNIRPASSWNHSVSLQEICQELKDLCT